MKQIVCANCGQSGGIAADMITGEKVCVICLSRQFKEVELPDELTCIYCKKTSKTEDILKIWKKIPFLDINTATYYCGCRGWE